MPRIKREIVGIDCNGRAKFFPSVTMAARAVGASPSNIKGSCDRKRGLVKGYKWFYKDDNRWRLVVDNNFELKRSGKGFREVCNIHMLNKIPKTNVLKQLELFE